MLLKKKSLMTKILMIAVVGSFLFPQNALPDIVVKTSCKILQLSASLYQASSSVIWGVRAFLERGRWEKYFKPWGARVTSSTECGTRKDPLASGVVRPW